MTIEDFVDIKAYYDGSRKQSQHIHALSLAEIFDQVEEPFVRWPVRNREPRTPIIPQKRAIIHERDGGICRLCGTGGHILTVDHIIPRSAFDAEDLAIADRSDNLISACWDCNMQKSNFESIQMKKLGVVAACWYCVNPGYDGDDPEFDELPYEVSVPVFCGRCGISTVPCVEGWVL